MKFVIISDTHEYHDQVKVPDGDILIHCGDWTNRGEPLAIQKFFYWFTNQPHKYKVCIPGNHELSLEGKQRPEVLRLINEYVNNTENLYFLENSSVEIEGIRFYGAAATPYFHGWAFNFQRGKDIAIEWKKIPENVQVLITHGPPHGILDMVQDTASNKGRDLHQGCEELAKKIKELKQLKIHVFGHLHTDGGKQTVVNNIIHANAAICTEQYSPTNPPIVIDLEV